MKRKDRKAVTKAILEPYLTAKKDRTILTQYVRVRPGDDGKIRTVLSSVGTETSRLSSSEAFYETSTNLQNLSQTVALEDELYSVRDVIVADPGMVLVAIDYDKAEAICAAAYSKDWKFLDMLLGGEDVHTWHASQFYSKREQDVQKIERNVSKNVTYASNYMAGVPTITRTVNKRADQIGKRLTEGEVRRILSTYMDMHPLRRWWDDVADELRSKGYLINAFGMKRQFFHPEFYKRWKEALAFLPQSTVACAINDSMIRIHDSVDTDGECELLLQVHDELLFQIKHDQISERVEQIKDIMESEFEIHGRKLYIPASAKAGESWGKMTSLSG